jgi:hypothetical protein
MKKIPSPLTGEGRVGVTGGKILRTRAIPELPLLRETAREKKDGFKREEDH